MEVAQFVKTMLNSKLLTEYALSISAPPKLKANHDFTHGMCTNITIHLLLHYSVASPVPHLSRKHY